MKYLFWDFNGTILDDVNLCYDILIEMLKEEDRPLISMEEYLMIFTFPIVDYYKKVYDLSKVSYQELAHRFIKKYQPRSLNLKLHDNVISTIDALTQQGYRHVLLSASEEKNLKEQVKYYQIDHLFYDILGTSDVYAHSKVEVAKKFIKDNHIKPDEILMIGDTLHDAEVAQSLGCKIILFTKGHQHPSRLQKYTNISHFHELIDKIEVV